MTTILDEDEQREQQSPYKCSFRTKQKPISWKRAGRRKDGKLFDEQKYLKSSFVKKCFEDGMKAPLTVTDCGLMALKSSFFFPRPKNHFVQQSQKRRGRGEEEASVRKLPLYSLRKKRYDIDNLVKFVTMDAFNGVIYADDSQVVDISAKKMFSSLPSNDPYLEITIEDVSIKQEETYNVDKEQSTPQYITPATKKEQEQESQQMMVEIKSSSTQQHTSPNAVIDLTLE